MWISSELRMPDSMLTAPGRGCTQMNADANGDSMGSIYEIPDSGSTAMW
jgi:hypothetical protein